MNIFRLTTDMEYAKARLAEAILSGDVTVNVKTVGVNGARLKVVECNLMSDVDIVTDGDVPYLVLYRFIERHSNRNGGVL